MENDYIKHIIKKCEELKGIRKRFNIEGSINHALCLEENNILNLMKFLNAANKKSSKVRLWTEKSCSLRYWSPRYVIICYFILFYFILFYVAYVDQFWTCIVTFCTVQLHSNWHIWCISELIRIYKTAVCRKWRANMRICECECPEREQ